MNVEVLSNFPIQQVISWRDTKLKVILVFNNRVLFEVC